MHEHELLIFLALLIFSFGLFSKLAERHWITGPMVFMTVGILGSSIGADFLEMSPEIGPIKLIAEITLVLVLFTDASLLNIEALRKAPSHIPTRLLLIGLPLTMVFGAALGVLFFPSAGFVAVILMALILSPTDAALGQAVVKNEKVPLNVRQSISVESGLNDGIALPPILVCLALLGAEAGHQEGSWHTYMIQQVTLGPLAGLAVGWIGGTAMQRVVDNDWADETFQRIAALPLAIIAYALAESVGGNGFIAAFVAGIGLNLSTASNRTSHRMQEFAEAEGTLLMLVVFLIFGLTMVPVAITHWGPRELLYALASLTVVRMVPVAISLMGTKLDWQTVAFIGWFGPRGIASILYLLMTIAAIGVEGNEQILSVIVLTVVISVFAHGLSAVPFSTLYEVYSSKKKSP